MHVVAAAEPGKTYPVPTSHTGALRAPLLPSGPQMHGQLVESMGVLKRSQDQLHQQSEVEAALRTTQRRLESSEERSARLWGVGALWMFELPSCQLANKS